MRHVKPYRSIQLNRTHPLTKGLLGCWVMNEASGEVVNDAASLIHKGNFDANAPTWVPGGLNFSRAGTQRLTCDYLPNLTNKSFTIFVIYTPATMGVAWHCLCQGGSAAATRFGAWIDTVGDMTIISNGYTTNTTTNLQAGTRYSLSYVHNYGVNNEFYIGGKSFGITANLAGPTADSGFRIGSDSYASPTYFADGKIETVMIFNRALSAVDNKNLAANPYQMFESMTIPRIYISAPPSGNPWYYYAQQQALRGIGD